MIDVYFDTSVVSALGKEEFPEEASAMTRLRLAEDASRVRLVTSEVTKEEIDRYAVAARPPVEAIYIPLSKVTYIPRQKLLGIHVYIDRYICLNAPMIEDNPLWRELLTLGLKDRDAHHLMVAIENRCPVFLTCDDRDFLKNARRKRTIEARWKIRLRRPSQYVVEEGF